MSPKDCPVLLSLFFLLNFIPPVAAVRSLLQYQPTELILLDCGASSSSTSVDGRSWDGDAHSKFLASNSENASSALIASPQEPSAYNVPYMTARISQSKFSYVFPLSPGSKFVRLYFYPTKYSNLEISKSFFSVKANDYTLLSNFNAFLAISAANSSVNTLIKEYVIAVLDNQNLNLTFSASTGSFAFINGIEIVSMPSNLYSSGIDNPLTYVGYSNLFYLDNTKALETFYRLNVGGNDISGSGDTGMYRTWLQDSNYLSGGFSGLTVIPQRDLKIKYTLEIPDYTAPVLVYSTMRCMGPDTLVNLNYNLTWYFSVDSGFNYLVRLHFYEFRREVAARQNQVVFSIFINNQTAEEGVDVISMSDGKRVPLYKDYIVWVPVGSQDLWLDLHPQINTQPKPTFTDAILNGLEIFKLNNSDGSLAGSNPKSTLLPPVPSRHPRLSTETKSKKLSSVVVIVIGLGAVIVIASVLCFVVYKRKKKLQQIRVVPLTSKFEFHSTSTISSSLPTDRCRRFSIVEIKSATRNFNDQNFIGCGGFGNVYKGDIEFFRVAIKRLDSSSKQGAQEFKTEIEMLSQLRHMNLVLLIGYCIDEGEMILVYDYMINGTLRQHLYETNSAPLPWKKRLEICIGAARGLHYLHSGMIHTIIHRDVKTTNILLDEKWIARVSDFGLSKVSFNQEVSTIVKGTWGYLDPEYARYQQLTEKSDVYAFGVVLFEVLFARKPVNHHLQEEEMNLINWAQKCIRNGTIYQQIDPFLKGKISPEGFNKFVEIALSCVHSKGIERPTMNEVIWELEFALELHEAADAERRTMNPEDDECVYPDASFAATRHPNSAGGLQLDSSVASGLGTCSVSNTGLEVMISNTSTN